MNEYNEQNKQTQKRVGTFTMGITLIVYGIVMLIGLFVENFDFYFVARFSPVVLILLGAEVLYRYFKSDSGQLKYDFVSGACCLFLVGSSTVLAAFLTMMDYYIRYWG